MTNEATYAKAVREEQAARKALRAAEARLRAAEAAVKAATRKG